jgi:MFS family permease
MSLAWLDVTIMTVAIPVIARQWGTSLIGWTMSAYMVPLTIPPFVRSSLINLCMWRRVIGIKCSGSTNLWSIS